MRSGRIVLSGDSKSLSNKDFEKAYFGFKEGLGDRQAHF